MNNKISVIVPVYNSSNTIKRCIDSIITQTYSDIELLLINDGSKDDSDSIIKDYLNDRRIKYIIQNNSGVSIARNRGIDESTGNYITFIDSDDWIEIDFLEKLFYKINETKSDIVCCNYYYFSDKSEFKAKSYNDSVMTKYDALNTRDEYYRTMIWGKMFKREVLKNIRFDKDIYYSEDTLFYTELLLNSEKVCWINEYLYHYMINDNGAMKNKNLLKYDTDYLARFRICELYNDLSFPYILKKQARSFLYLSCINIVLECIKQKNYGQIYIKNLKRLDSVSLINYFFDKNLSIKDKLKLIYIEIKRMIIK